MTVRNYFHIYQILEKYSKEFISFEYSPEFILIQNYPLSKKEINRILKNNGLLIKALYERDENQINEILSNPSTLPYNNYSYAQLSEQDALFQNKNPEVMKKGLPLPIQARYVLKAWNAIRKADINTMEELSTILNNKAFSGSLYTQITLMALNFNRATFNSIALETNNTLTTKESFYLYYKLLAYYYRIKNNKELKDICNSLAKNYINNLEINSENIEAIRRNLK